MLTKVEKTQPQTTVILEHDSSLLEQAIQATQQTTRLQATELLQNLVTEALAGTITWKKNLTITINTAIAKLDTIISKQLATIMHTAKFKELEGAWQGLYYLVKHTETSSTLKIKLLNLAKTTLFKDLNRAVEFDQSQLFKKIYENEFGTPGGEPYGVLIGNYEFTNHPEDISLLASISNIAAAGFCPFIAAASPQLFGFNQWAELCKPRDLEKIFTAQEYARWRSLRDTQDARFISLVMPRVLARLPYGKATQPIEAFNYEETLTDMAEHTKQLSHEDYCWMNAAYVMGVKLTNAFSEYGWCTAIRGAESGGKVENLPLHIFHSDDGDIDTQCPTEIGITDRREAELSRLGILPLCHYKNTDYAVFFGSQTIQRAKQYDRYEATANAAISARLPYVMATSRFAHYLKVMARDKIGSFMEVTEVEEWLNRWILNYVNGNQNSGQEMKARYPLAEATVKVAAIPGKPGAYHAIAWLRPWLQLEELTTSMRLVATIPKIG
jgi:type VI secretion system protein ImpC